MKPKNPPIAIWQGRYRGAGIGTLVMQTVIFRLKALGFSTITGSEVYKWNPVSQRMHEKLGFRRVSENEDSYIYELDLTQI
ncbi:MAG: GNAT family N-acetyltransferase [Clostridia bacterium]|nr:GNAT family N-acetyltransferase [Clostridia bacterium]